MRPEKEAIVRDIKALVAGANYVILTDFTRMGTGTTATLRRMLRGTGPRFQVVPNRLFRVVARELKYEGLEPALKGPTALVLGAEDIAATAKVLREFVRANDKIPVVKLGYMEGRVLTAVDIEALASLPSKKIMQGVLVGTIAAPMSNLVGVMNQKLASLVYVLKAAADKRNAA